MTWTLDEYRGMITEERPDDDDEEEAIDKYLNVNLIWGFLGTNNE
jgi:hypothetical protein